MRDAGIDELAETTTAVRTKPRSTPLNAGHRLLAGALRTIGVVDMTAVALPFLPDAWITACHAWLGLGPLPTEPIVGYLARSASVMYALHGLMVFYVSFDMPRYWSLIRLLAITAIIHGALMSLIDYRVGMPWWWSLLEGPCFAATGMAALVLQALAGPPEASRTPE